MKEIKLTKNGDSISYSVPESWHEVTVEQFNIFMKIKEKLDGDENLSVTDSVDIISAITEIPEEIFYSMYPDEFNKVSKHLDFLNEVPPKEEAEEIELEGETYYLKKDFDKLTMGEVASIETLIKKNNGDAISAIPQLMPIFFRKKLENGELESFNPAKMEERANTFKRAPITSIYRCLLFFSNGKDSLEPTTKDSLAETKRSENQNVTDSQT